MPIEIVIVALKNCVFS